MSNTKKDDLMIEMLQKGLQQHDKLNHCITKLDKKLDIFALETKNEIEKIHKLDEEQNRILDEHQQRSTELKKENELTKESLTYQIQETQKQTYLLKDYITEQVNNTREQNNLYKKDLDVRLVKLEAPQKWLAMTKKLLVGIGSLAGAVYMVGKIFGYL